MREGSPPPPQIGIERGSKGRGERRRRDGSAPTGKILPSAARGSRRSEGRRRRKRDTTTDAIGQSLKRDILEGAVAEDPDPDAFEGRLLGRCFLGPDGTDTGARRAMGRDVMAGWRLAVDSPAFWRWLEADAPSADRGAPPQGRRRSTAPVIAAWALDPAGPPRSRGPGSQLRRPRPRAGRTGRCDRR